MGDFFKELAELLKTYSIQEIADALNVSYRSVQNYISKSTKKEPRAETARKIHEIYTNHKNGRPLTDQKDSSLETLIENNKKLTEATLINARNMERLITIFENRIQVSAVELEKPGTPGTETEIPKRFKNEKAGTK